MFSKRQFLHRAAAVTANCTSTSTSTSTAISTSSSSMLLPTYKKFLPLTATQLSTLASNHSLQPASHHSFKPMPMPMPMPMCMYYVTRSQLTASELIV